MLVKQVVTVMLLSSFICNAVQQRYVERVKPNSVKQALKLIRAYDRAKSTSKKQHKEQLMRDLLDQLIIESGDFGGAVKAEAMGGELEASNVNLNEKVGLDTSIKLLQEKLASINGQQPLVQQKALQKEVSDSTTERLNKRRRPTN